MGEKPLPEFRRLGAEHFSSRGQSHFGGGGGEDALGAVALERGPSVPVTSS
jgi:hypothetical protein